jgi:hypothetical protein
MTVKDSRTEEEQGNAADLLKLVMVRKCWIDQCFTIALRSRAPRWKSHKEELHYIAGTLEILSSSP